MKNRFLPLILLLIFPSCLKKKTTTERVVTPVVSKPVEVKKAGEAKFDEDVEEFYLEDEESGNIFEDTSTAKPASDIDLIEIDLDDQRGEVVQFDFDKTDIKQKEMPKVSRNAEHAKDVLREHKDAAVVVNGHSCKIAKSKTYNYMISQERANHVKTEYVNQGCPEKRVKALGHGDSQLVTTANGKKAQAPNRRAETAFVKNT